MLLGIFLVVLAVAQGIFSIPRQRRSADSDFPSSTNESTNDAVPSQDYKSLFASTNGIKNHNSSDGDNFLKNQLELNEFATVEDAISKSIMKSAEIREKIKELAKEANNSSSDNFTGDIQFLESEDNGNSSVDNSELESTSADYDYVEVSSKGKTNVTVSERTRLERDDRREVTTLSKGSVDGTSSSNGKTPDVSLQMSNSSDKIDKPVQSSNISRQIEKTADSLDEIEKSAKLDLEETSGQSEIANSTSELHIHSSIESKLKADLHKFLSTCSHCTVEEYFLRPLRNTNDKPTSDLNNSKGASEVNQDIDFAQIPYTQSKIEGVNNKTHSTNTVEVRKTTNSTNKSNQKYYVIQNQESEPEVTRKSESLTKSTIASNRNTNQPSNKINSSNSNTNQPSLPIKTSASNSSTNQSLQNKTVPLNNSSNQPSLSTKTAQSASPIHGHPSKSRPSETATLSNKGKGRRMYGNMFHHSDSSELEKNVSPTKTPMLKDYEHEDNGKKIIDVQPENNETSMVDKKPVEKTKTTTPASEEEETAEERDRIINDAMNWQGDKRMDSIDGLRRGSLQSKISFDDTNVRNLGGSSIVSDDDEQTADRNVGEFNEVLSSGMINRLSIASLLIILMSFHWVLRCSGTILSALSGDYARSAMDLDPELHYFENPQ